MTTTTESIGEFFKQVRETKGLSLDDVASKTRIHPNFLIALEDGNFAKLPDQVFAKGFVRSYARSLGLDEEDAMRRFEQSAGAFYDKQAERERLRLRQAEDERRKKANRKVVVAGAGVAMLALILLLTREQSSAPVRQPSEPPRPLAEPMRPSERISDRPADIDPIPPLPARPPSRETVPSVPLKKTPEVNEPSRAEERVNVPEPAPSLSTTAPSSGTERSASPPVASARPDPLAGLPIRGSVADGSTVLDLEASELTWVVVQVDDGSPQEALLRPGERVRWKGGERFVLTLGNAGGVRVELNGKVMGPFGPSGKVARDIVLKR